MINADYQPTGLTTPHNAITIGPKKKIALVAHDNKKVELVEWARFNSGLLHDHELYMRLARLVQCSPMYYIQTSNTFRVVHSEEIFRSHRLSSREIDGLIFFWDSLESQTHSPDRQSIVTHCRRLECTNSQQQGQRRLHHLISADALKLQAPAAFYP